MSRRLKAVKPPRVLVSASAPPSELVRARHIFLDTDEPEESSICVLPDGSYIFSASANGLQGFKLPKRDAMAEVRKEIDLKENAGVMLCADEERRIVVLTVPSVNESSSEEEDALVPFALRIYRPTAGGANLIQKIHVCDLPYCMSFVAASESRVVVLLTPPKSAAQVFVVDTKTKAFPKQWHAPHVAEPVSVAISRHSQHIMIADSRGIAVFEPDGTFVKFVPMVGIIDMAVQPSSQYVVVAHDDNAITVFSPSLSSKLGTTRVQISPQETMNPDLIGTADDDEEDDVEEEDGSDGSDDDDDEEGDGSDDSKEEEGSDDDEEWKPEEKGHALMKDTILSDDDESEPGKDVPFLNGEDSSLSFSTGDEDEKDDEETKSDSDAVLFETISGVFCDNKYVYVVLCSNDILLYK